MAKRALRVTAVAAAAQLGGTERVLLDFAARAFEYEIALRVLTPRDGPLVAIFNEIGVPTEVVPASAAMLAGSQRPGRLWSAPAALVGLAAWARRLARHRFVRDAEALYSVAFKTHLALALLRRHPVVWHLHEYPPATTGAAWRMISRHGPDAMIANSEATAEAWRGRGVGMTVIPNGVDLDRFHPRARAYWIHGRLGLPHTDRLIGMPAVFARWKGQIEVIRAFSLVAARFSDVHLVFVGGSIYDTVAEREYAAELEAAVGAASANVHLLPFQPKIELTYPEFDLVLHYSLRPEPFGRVILEAMASGVPVIAAGEGGPVQILGKREASNGKNGPANRELLAADGGWLTPPRDPAALAGVLRETLELPQDRLDAIGQAGRRRAEDHFSARQFARAVAEVVRGVALGSS